MTETVLTVENLECSYGHIKALAGIDLEVRAGEIVTLIGNNGAGKSTTLNAVCGVLPLNAAVSGRIAFRGERIDRLPSNRIIGRGICQVPEGRRVFPQMTVKENLMMGAFLRNDTAGIERDMKMVFHHFPVLKERQKQTGGTLSGGEQQMLAMGRALMSNPKLILMDEPSLGLSPIMCQEIAKIIKDIHAEGRTIVLVEQNARLALALAEKGYVLETGDIVLEGPAKDLRENDEVKKAYLGG